ISGIETLGSWTKSKLQERRLPQPTKVRTKAGQVHPPRKNTKRNFGLRQRKVQTSFPMTTPIEKRNASKLCEFHKEVGHTTDECMHLKKQIEEMHKAGKLSYLIKELKQNNGKGSKKGENLRKGQAAGNPNGTTMEKGSQTKDYPNFLSRDNDLIPIPKGGRWDEGPYDYQI
nr:hypothetical protein [Tanacetum cinerariifolium]